MSNAEVTTNKVTGELQEIIAKQAIMAFNQGVDKGAQQERARIMGLISELSNFSESNPIGEYLYVNDLIEYIEKDYEATK